VALTQTQLVTAIAERAELSKNDAKRALEALEQTVLEEIGNAQKVRVGGLVQVTVRLKPAQKARKGRNPRQRRGDHHRRKAGRRRPARATAGEGESGAAVRAKGATSPGQLNQAAAISLTTSLAAAGRAALGCRWDRQAVVAASGRSPRFGRMSHPICELWQPHAQEAPLCRRQRPGEDQS